MYIAANKGPRHLVSAGTFLVFIHITVAPMELAPLISGSGRAGLSLRRSTAAPEDSESQVHLGMC